MSELKSHEEVYDDFWKDIVENPDGTLNMDQLKRELAEWKFAMGEVAKVYCHVTGGQLSKPMYYAKDVIEFAEDYISQRCAWAIEDFLEQNGIDPSLYNQR